MKRPNAILYYPLAGILKIFARLKKQKISQSVKVTGPALVLTNHTSFYDYIYTTAATYPARINFVAADKFFYDPGMGFFLRLARAIPKCLFQPDVRAVINTLAILKKGGIVGIFPEGQISPIGKTYEFPKAIGKLIKRAQVPVYLVKHHNAYFSNPPWSKKSFKGPLFTSVECGLTVDQINMMNPLEITLFIQEKLNYNASEYNQLHKHTYQLSDITNLEKIIYQCPSCSHEGLEAKKDHLHCPKCLLDLPYTPTGLLGPYRLDELFQNQRTVIENNVENDPNFKLQEQVDLESYDHHRVRLVGKGTLTFSQTEYRYEGTINGVPSILTFAPKDIQYFPSDIGLNVQIYSNYVIYQFVFHDPISPTRFMILGEYLYRRYHQTNGLDTI